MNEDQDSARLARNEVRWDMFSCLLWYFFAPTILPFLTVRSVLSLAIKFYLMPNKPFIYWIQNLLEPYLFGVVLQRASKHFTSSSLSLKMLPLETLGPRKTFWPLFPLASPLYFLSLTQLHSSMHMSVFQSLEGCLCWALHHFAAFPLGIHDATL